MSTTVEINTLESKNSPQHAPGATKRTKPRARTLHWFPLLLLRVAVLALVIGAWKLAAEMELANATALSDPVEVWDWLVQAVQGPVLWDNLWATLESAAIALVLAVVIGVIIGISLALLPRVEQVVDPFLNALNATPRIALAPLFIVAFGLSDRSKIALAFSIVVFLIISTARAGVRSVDAEHMRLMTVLGASGRQKFTKVLFPVAVPSIFGGIRLGVIYSLLGTLTAELMGSVDGIGQQLQIAAGTFQTDAIYGLIIVLMIVAVIINNLFGRVEEYLLRWQAPADR